MHLSWNEIRARAGRFAADWKDARYERGETQTFYNEFFEVFGVSRRRVASYEEPVKLLGKKRGFIDLFWKGVLLVEQKSAGRDLKPAKQQALDYFPGLKDYALPRYVLLSDFQHFELYDLDEGTPPVKFHLRDLARNIEAFTFILGVEKRTFRDQDPVNIKAAEMMGRLHDALKASGYTGHNLERGCWSACSSACLPMTQASLSRATDRSGLGLAPTTLNGPMAASTRNRPSAAPPSGQPLDLYGYSARAWWVISLQRH